MLTVDQIRAVVAAYFKDKPVKSVWLFGSYARGEAKEDSDVDLLIDIDDSKKRLSYFDLARFLGDLQDQLMQKVDLIEEQGLYPKIRPQVIRDRQLLYRA